MKIKNITTNLGILPINLGPARLQISEHTFVHYYDLQSISREYDSVNNQYNTFKLGIENNSVLMRELTNYEKLVKFAKLNIDDKYNNIQVYSPNRLKRGLIDGLGSIVKVVTGNLDANDGKKIDSILKNIENNQTKFQNQFQIQYSVNHQIIQQFNETVKNIQHNEIVLKSRIFQMIRRSQEQINHEDIFFAKDLYSQIINLYNNILAILQDIENSILFCRLNVLHPSIIKPQDLYNELQRITAYYKTQLPFELKFENIQNFESIIKVNCRIEKTRIIYFLSIPLNSENQYELYHLYPIPTKTESGFITVIPNFKYLLKDKNDNIKSLDGICTQGKTYQCSSPHSANNDITCEQNIILHGNADHCEPLKINMLKNHIEAVPNTNQYLGVFPNDEIIKSKCAEDSESKILNGIYLIQSQKCQVYFRDNEITFIDETQGKPLLTDNLIFQWKEENIPKMEINLKSLNLKDIPINSIIPIATAKYQLHLPSIWTIIIYVVAIIIAGWYITCNILRKKKKLEITIPSKDESLPLQPSIQLPADASF